MYIVHTIIIQYVHHYHVQCVYMVVLHILDYKCVCVCVFCQNTLSATLVREEKNIGEIFTKPLSRDTRTIKRHAL